MWSATLHCLCGPQASSLIGYYQGLANDGLLVDRCSVQALPEPKEALYVT